MPDSKKWASPISLTRAMDLVSRTMSGPNAADVAFEQLKRTDPKQYAEEMARLQALANRTMVGDTANAPLFKKIGQTLAAGIGLAPSVGEPMYEYWARNMPNTMPDAVQRKQGRTSDIELKAETLGNMLSSGGKNTATRPRK